MSFSLENKWAKFQVPGPRPCVSRNKVPPAPSSLHMITDFHSVTGLPIAFLSLRKNISFESRVPAPHTPCLQGRATSACL